MVGRAGTSLTVGALLLTGCGQTGNGPTVTGSPSASDRCSHLPSTKDLIDSYQLVTQNPER